MDGLGNFLGRHFVAPFAALSEAWYLTIFLVLIWLMYPVAVQTIIHPEDAVGFQQWLQGLPVSQFVTSQAKNWGLLNALFVLIFLFLAHFLILLLIYRQTQRSFSTWIVALLLIGVVANGMWWLRTGYFDISGALAGLMPLVLVIAIEAVFEHLGQDFVFGKGERPDFA
jgi:hypothetical protein